MSVTKDQKRTIEVTRELHLPGVRECFIQKAREAVKERLSPEGYLWGVLDYERALRRTKEPAQNKFCMCECDVICLGHETRH